jgi:hypothetical protein
MPKPQSQWEINYLQRQAMINGYARQLYQPRLRELETIALYTPNEHRRYLRQHPCTGCGAEPCCDEPCAAYLRWYDARLEAARAKSKRQEL